MVMLKLFNCGSYYEPPTPKIGKEVKAIRMLTFFCYIVSILLFIKIKMIKYPNFMRQHIIGMIRENIFFSGLEIEQMTSISDDSNKFSLLLEKRIRIRNEGGRKKIKMTTKVYAEASPKNQELCDTILSKGIFIN